MILRAIFFIFLLTNTTLLSQKNNSNSIYGELGNYVIKNYEEKESFENLIHSLPTKAISAR